MFLILYLVAQIVAQQSATTKMQGERNGELAYGLSEDHLSHSAGHEPSRFPLGLAVQDRARRRISGECERRKRVHDQVDPEKLNSIENRLLLIAGYCSDECQYDSRNIDGQLELQREVSSRADTEMDVLEIYLKELLHRIVDSTAPHHTLDDGAEPVSKALILLAVMRENFHT